MPMSIDKGHRDALSLLLRLASRRWLKQNGEYSRSLILRRMIFVDTFAATPMRRSLIYFKFRHSAYLCAPISVSHDVR